MAGRQVKPEAKELRERLQTAGVSLQQLADSLGVTKGCVWQQFAGHRPLQARTREAAQSMIWERVRKFTLEARRLADDLQQQTLEEADAATPAAVP